jgi:hypothetical protein
VTAAIPGPELCDVDVILSRDEARDEDTRRAYLAVALSQAGAPADELRASFRKLEPTGRQFIENRPGFIELRIRHRAGPRPGHLQLTSTDVWRELNAGPR